MGFVVAQPGIMIFEGGSWMSETKKTSSVNFESPFVSIILPICNEVRYIERCLNAVLAQDYPADRMEILIADGMSTDGTRDIVADLAARYSQFTIYILDNPGKIVPTGLNIALRRARGDIIIRVDGHCVITPNYIRNCIKHIQNDGVDGVGGPMESIGETFLSKSIAIGVSSPFGVGGSAFRTIEDRPMLVDTIAFPAYTRQAIEKTGLFDEELVRNQDDEYNFRLRKLGGKVLLSPDIRSSYYSRSSLGSLWKQYFQYGYWKVRVLQKHPFQMSFRHFVPPAFMTALIGSVLLSIFSPYGWMLFSLVIGAYLLANFIASLWTAGQRGWKYLSLLPVIYVILHFSYGLGFLAGLLRFANRWGDKVGKVPPLPLTDH